MIKKLTKLSFEQKYCKNLLFFFSCDLHNLSWLFSSALTESGELSNYWSLDYEHFVPVRTALYWMSACIQTVRLLLKWNTDTQFLLSHLLLDNFCLCRALSILTTSEHSLPSQQDLKIQNRLNLWNDRTNKPKVEENILKPHHRTADIKHTVKIVWVLTTVRTYRSSGNTVSFFSFTRHAITWK